VILLTNGKIVDGSGAPSERSSLLVDDGKIIEIGFIESSAGMDVYDCAGCIISPGFIDVHSHSDLEVLEHRPERVRQGVTSEVVGNCGFSLFPGLPEGPLVPSFNLFERRGQRKWADAESYFENLQETGTYTNVASLVGHASLRANVSGMKSGALKPEEMRQAEKCLSACLEQGAIGLSTGLNEVPSSYGDFDELVQLCEVVRKYRSFYTSHLRDYKFRILDAVEEALNLGRRAGVAVQLSHLQTVGRKNWEKMDEVLALVDRAAAEGVDVGIDAYPYLAGSCHLTQCLPTWALEGGTEQLLGRLTRGETRDRIAKETEAGMANTWEDIVVCSLASTEMQASVGMTIQDLANKWDCSGVEAALDLLVRNRGAVRIVSFNQSDENLRKVLSHPLTSIITDGLVTEGKSHPRTFGTYPTLIGEFVNNRKWFCLEHAVHKATGLPASRFKLSHRGLIRKGYWADLLVFNPKTIGTRATYLEPDTPPDGIIHVMVNGAWVVRSGSLQANFPGQVLKN
jgi:N-acyl-D-amino-acid deacylase